MKETNIKIPLKYGDGGFRFDTYNKHKYKYAYKFFHDRIIIYNLYVVPKEKWMKYENH